MLASPTPGKDAPGVLESRRAEGLCVCIFGTTRSCQALPLPLWTPTMVEFQPSQLPAVWIPPVFEAVGTTSNSPEQRMLLKDLFSLDMSAADGREGNNKDFSATFGIYSFKKNILKKKKIPFTINTIWLSILLQTLS